MSVIFNGMSAEEGGYQIERSLRFNSADSAYLSRTPASAGNRKTWTWSGWVKKTVNTTTTPPPRILGAGISGSGETGITLSGDSIEVYRYASGYTFQLITTAKYRDPSSFYHLLVAYDTSQATSSNRIKVYVNGEQVTSFSTSTYPPTQNAEYEVNNTVAHRIGHISGGGASDYLNGYLADVHFIDGSALDPTSFGEFNSDTGVWQPKAYAGTYGTNGFYLNFSDNSAATPAGLGKDYSGMAGNIIVGTSTSGSTTLSVVSLTGISVGNIVTGPGIPDNTYVVSTGALSVTLSQAATSSNTSTNYTFSGNNWTPNNFSVTAGAGNDSMVDVPTNYGTDTGAGGEVRGNYCTLNPLKTFPSVGTGTVQNGNLESYYSGSAETANAAGMAMPASGKWYFEMTALTNPGSGTMMFGVAPESRVLANAGNGREGVYRNNGQAYNLSGSVVTTYSTWTTNDVLGCAVDNDNGRLFFSKNGVWQGSSNPAAGTNPLTTFTPQQLWAWCTNDNNAGVKHYAFNFGQRPFSYTAPSGFKALCTENLPTPTIADGGNYFNTVLYTGNGSTQSITGVGFQPDFVWAKGRSVAYSNRLYDVIRGATKSLVSNNTDGEATLTTQLTAFASDGFTLGSDAGLNQSSATYVAWNWKAGGSGVSNTAGTITSTVSANTTAGFSIVTYTGVGGVSTVGHGLGVAPSFFIVKNRTQASDWECYFAALGNQARIVLNSTAAAVTGINGWNSTSPTSTVFTVNGGTAGNTNGNNHVAYCFAPVEGYSAFGSYVGNGSADGPFVYTNMRSRYILIKKSSAAQDWYVWDTERDTYNPAPKTLFPNGSFPEESTRPLDVLSNGFKLRISSAMNDSGATYIYAAFAENPFKYSLAR